MLFCSNKSDEWGFYGLSKRKLKWGYKIEKLNKSFAMIWLNDILKFIVEGTILFHHVTLYWINYLDN